MVTVVGLFETFSTKDWAAGKSRASNNKLVRVWCPSSRLKESSEAIGMGCIYDRCDPSNFGFYFLHPHFNRYLLPSQLSFELFYPNFSTQKIHWAQSGLYEMLQSSIYLPMAEPTSKTPSHEIVSRYKHTFNDDPFIRTTLPQLVKHYRRDALSELQSQHDWIHSFESISQEPEFSGPRTEFFRHGSGCINTLDRYSELLRIGLANDFFTKSKSINSYAWFIYGLSKTPQESRIRDHYLGVFSQEIDERFRYRESETEVDAEDDLFFDETKRAAQRDVASRGLDE